MSAHDELRTRLARVRRHWFRLAALSAVGRAAAAASVPLFVVGAAGWLLQPSGPGLMVLSAVALVAAVAAGALAFSRMPRRPDDRRVARFIEEQTVGRPGFGLRSEELVSAVDVAARPVSARFDDIVLRRALRTLDDISPSDVIPRERLRRASMEAAGGAVVLAAAAVLASPWLLPAAAAAYVRLVPGSIEIVVRTGDVRVAAGQPLSIGASIRGRGARWLGVRPSLEVSADGQHRAVPMDTKDDGFVYRFASVDRSFEYRVSAAGRASSAYSVTALFPARVRRIDVHYEYPSFTGLPSRDEEDAGDIYAPAGTKVRMTVHTDKPVRTASLALAAGAPIPLSGTGARTMSGELVLARNDAYRVALTDEDGLESRGDLEYFIRLMDDRPPDVHIVRPAGDRGITPLEEVVIEARADDDYGIERFELVYAVGAQPPRTVPFKRVSGTGVAKIGSRLLAAEDLHVQPGDVITYYARARDVPRGTRSTEARSDMFFLEVKPFSEEFTRAESQAGGGASGTQIDNLIAVQKEIISATWNIERRSAAGRSASDTRAVSLAQAELKARVQQMLGGRRGRPGFQVPQQVGPARPQSGAVSRPNPVGAAVEAMGRAVEQLDRDRTAEAIPHQMAALQGLLQAQAEVRRRQVMQQSASAAGQGGTSRTDRDLSALFDRELQRQQRTNYETPRESTDAPREEGRSDALDRIRDLARRQEALAQRQREIAGAGLTAAERQRQLERLTRDQQALRRELEGLQKQMTSGDGPPRSSEIGRAGEEMRSAAAEMQRQNAGGAADRARKAAEALRQAEGRMRGSSADARARAAGELQLEAQQIADAQRRIASGLSRLGKDAAGGGTAEADARRRLAGEQDALAERLGELQRAATQLERHAPGPAGAPFRDAAGALEREQIGRRMRASADAIRRQPAPAGARGGSDPSSAVREGEQIASALDSVVDALAGKSQDGGRRAAQQLDRARDIRDRLQRLEQQVREAEAAARSAGRTGHQPSGQQGRSGAGSSTPGNSANAALQRAREGYQRELERAREALSRLEAQQRGEGGSTPEEHQYSLSAPGNEAFKQDFSGWEKLRRDVDVRLERFESAAAARLAQKSPDGRLTIGGSEQVPDKYKDAVSRYFESLAKAKK